MASADPTFDRELELYREWLAALPTARELGCTAPRCRCECPCPALAGIDPPWELFADQAEREREADRRGRDE